MDRQITWFLRKSPSQGHLRRRLAATPSIQSKPDQNHLRDQNMPDRSKLRAGDRIRILSVPACDLAQREREIATSVEMAGWTADTIERVIAVDPVVVIDRIDEHGAPWFDVELVDDGVVEHHSLTILDDDSWEHCA